MITPDEVTEVPSVEGVCVTDPTGGGNSSSGAVLYGYCNQYTPKECGLIGSIAAAKCLEQYGVPEVLDQGAREKARELLERMRGSICDEK